MVTPFQEVYDVFLSKITDYDYLEFTEEDLKLELNQKLKSACAKIVYKDFSLDMVNECFSRELSDLEQEIVACWLVYEWINPRINNIEVLKQRLSNKDFQMYSQANHLKELRQLRKDIKKEASYLTNRLGFINMV